MYSTLPEHRFVRNSAFAGLDVNGQIDNAWLTEMIVAKVCTQCLIGLELIRQMRHNAVPSLAARVGAAAGKQLKTSPKSRLRFMAAKMLEALTGSIASLLKEAVISQELAGWLLNVELHDPYVWIGLEPHVYIARVQTIEICHACEVGLLLHAVEQTTVVCCRWHPDAM